MGRSALAIVVGLVVGVVTIALIQGVSSALYPLPEGVDPHSEEFREIMPTLPPGAFVMVLAAWGIGTALGAGVTAHLARKGGILHGLIVGGVLMLLGMFPLFMLPHPGWFRIVALVLYLPAAYLGALVGTQPLPGHHEGWLVDEPPNYAK